MVSEQEEKSANLEAKVLKLEKQKTELLIANKDSEKQIVDLQKRRDAAKHEILNLNSKLQKLSTKMTTTDASQNHGDEILEEPRSESNSEDAKEFEKAYNKSWKLLNKLLKGIEEIYKDFINLLIHAEETNSSCKKLVYDLERRINGLKITINEHFDDISIQQKSRKEATNTPRKSPGSVVSRASSQI